jgi:prevent-host-death family protein
VRTVNIHEAKTQLSKLVDQAAKGESFVIAKAGKPMVRVIPMDAPASPQRVGFMTGEIAVPDDFDRMGSEQIEGLFGGDV